MRKFVLICLLFASVAAAAEKETYNEKRAREKAEIAAKHAKERKARDSQKPKPAKMYRPKPMKPLTIVVGS